MKIDREIVSELRNFFTESGCELGLQRIMNILGTINITEKQIGFEKKPNCKSTCAQVIQNMTLFPFFSIKNEANYVGSHLQFLFDCQKDMFYLLSYVKMFESYETIGALLREITVQTVELSVNEKIWGLIQRLVFEVADFFSVDPDELLTNIINGNKQLNAIMRVAQQLQPAAYITCKT